MKVFVAALIAASLGLAGGWVALRNGAPQTAAVISAEAPIDVAIDALAEAPGYDTGLIATLRSLKAAIDEQARRQDVLAKELLAFHEELEAMRQPGAVAALAEERADTPRAREQQTPVARSERRRQALIDAGFAAGTADEIVAAVDAVAIERLDLRYEAARKGWLNTPEYREKASALPNARDLVRDEYGEDAYDRYLYATGRPNRVIVSSLLANSPAEQMGLRPGDTLIDFAGERVYSSRDVMRIATRGDPDELVSLRLTRDGDVVEYYVPRAPLGINTRRGSEKPPE